MPSGLAETTTYDYATIHDPNAGVTTETTQSTDPTGVTTVTHVKTYENGAPRFLPESGEGGGWLLPIDDEQGSFELSGFQVGDAVMCPRYIGATATTMIEVAASGTYCPRTLSNRRTSSTSAAFRIRFVKWFQSSLTANSSPSTGSA